MMRAVSAPGRLAPLRFDPIAWLCGLWLIACAVFLFRGALHTYFAQEDFRGLAVATGVLPRYAGLWRYVSVQAFMDLTWPLFRERAAPYHAVILALHALNAILLFALLAKPCGRAAALVGATFFAVHPVLFTALYWQSARADVLAATFALATVILALRPGRVRWLALPAFALALPCKESVLPLPAALWFLQRWREERTDRLTVALCLVSAAYALYLLAPRHSGIAIAFDPRQAYGLDFGGSMLRNLLTYPGWAVDLPRLTPGLRYVDAPNPDLFPLSAIVLTACAVAATWPPLEVRGFHVGVVGFLLLLIPVLPLRNHTYHYYLYAPLLPFSLSLAALIATLGERIGERRLWQLAAMACLTLAWNGNALVQHLEARTSQVYPELRGDPIVDRARIAEHAIRTLRQASLPNGTKLVFLSRPRAALLGRILQGSREAAPPADEAYPETNVRTALFDGIAVRALVPGVDSVAFARAPEAGAPRGRYAIYATTGEVQVYEGATLDSLMRTRWAWRR
jgi:hypothetical protein